MTGACTIGVGIFLLLGACAESGGAPSCPPSAPCPPPPTCPPPPACPSVQDFETAALTDPTTRMAIESVQHLFNEDFAPVRAHLTPSLSGELSDDKLVAIVRGLTEAHGPPAQIVDAWHSAVEEKKERMPAAQVLVRMANGVRVSLLLVFDPAGAVKGLWLRPI
jgi:hypothetical protein